MPTHLTSLLPPRLRAGVRTILDVLRDPVRCRHVLIRAAGRPHGCMPQVSYGRAMPKTGEIVSGGFAKFTHLARAFPHHPYRFNLLYLGSSSMPPDALAQVETAKRKGAKFVWNQNGVAYPAWSRNWEAVNRPMSALLKAADHVFFQSDFCVATAREFLGPTTAMTEVLYNPVDTNVFTPAECDPAPGQLVVLTAGSIEDWYRFEVGARTIACLRDAGMNVTWIVAGRLAWRQPSHDAVREAKALVDGLSLRKQVELVPPFGRDLAPAIFRRAHVFLHPQYNDSSPTVVLEAMSSGLPVVYSVSGGTPEHVGEAGIGVSTPKSLNHTYPPDPVDLAAAIVEVSRQRAKYASVARRRAIQHFGVERWVDRHRQVFQELLGSWFPVLGSLFLVGG